MPQSLANFDAALKDNYGPGLRNSLNNSNPVWTEVGRNEEDIIGRKAVWSVHTGRSTSTGARGELASLPSADRQRFTQVEDALVYNYHTIKVSGQAKHLTRNDTGAFARALETEIDGAEKDLKNDRARQAYGQKLTDGTNLQAGVIATLSADPGTGTDFTVANEPDSVMRHFFIGESLRAINPAGGAARTGTYVVTAINKSTKVVSVDTAIDAGVASGDYLVRGDANGNSFGDEINGLRHLISDDVYAGIDPANVPSWAAVTAGSSSTPISEVLLDEADENVQTDGDGSSPNLYLAEYVQRRKLASLLQAQKRYEGRQMTLKAGWKGLQIAQGALVVDRYNPTTTIFGLTTKEIERFVGLDFTWDEDDGKVLYKALDGSDAVEARFKVYDNLEATNRNSHVLVTVSEPAF